MGGDRSVDREGDIEADAVDRSDPSHAPAQADTPQPEVGRLDAFVSYARRPLDRQFVDWLEHRLTGRGKTVWLDRSSIAPASDWRRRIDRGIESATSVIVVITPDSARSPECAREIDAASRANKRIVPLLLCPTPVADLPPAITRLNWIDCQDVERHEDALDEILEALESDLDWHDAHARLTARAREWAASGRDRSFLLRGRDLRAAEDWYGEKDLHKEQPTDEHYQFIAASRRSAARRQRGVLVAVVIGLIVSLGAGAVALIQRQNAIDQRQAAVTQAERSQSEQMALQAQSLFPTNTPAGILVALAAYERYPTAQARNALAQAAATRLLGILSVPVSAFAYSPDGRTFATADASGLVSLWDTASHMRIRTWKDDGQVNWLVFSPDGRTLASGDNNGRAVVWRVADGVRERVFAPGGDVNSLAFSSDGRLLATGSWAPNSGKNGAVALWNVSTGRRVWSHYAPGPNVDAEAFSPGGSVLATGDAGNDVTLWDVARGTKKSVWNAGNSVWSLAFSPDGGTLAAGTGGGAVLWNVATATEKTLDSGADVGSVAFNSDGRLLALGDYVGNITLWTIPSNTKIAAWNDGGSLVGRVAFSPDGKTLASVAVQAGKVVFWDVSLVDDRGVTTTVPAFSPDGKLLATGDSKGLTLSDVATGAVVTRLAAPGGVTNVVFSPDGRWIALADARGPLWLWNWVTHQQVKIGEDPESLTSAFSPDGRILAEGDATGRVRLWDVFSHRKRYWEFPGAGQIFDLAFSSDSRTLAVPEAFGSSGLIALRSVATGETERSWNWPSPVNQVVFGPGGRTLVVGDQGGRVTLLSVRAGATATAWNDGNIVTGLAFSRTAGTLAIGDAAGNVTLWNLGSGAKTAANTGGQPWVAFSPDSRTLAVNIGPVVLYPTAVWTGSWATIRPLLCGELGKFNLTRTQWASYAADGSYQHPCG